MFTGIGLIVIGVMLALRQAGLIPWFYVGALWPVVLIALGLRIIYRHRTGGCRTNRHLNPNANLGSDVKVG